MAMDGLHTSEIPPKGAAIKVVQTDNSGKKKVVSTVPAPPRTRSLTLGVISELPNQDQTPESIPQRNHNSSSGRIRTSSSSSISDSAFLPVVSGHLKAFGEQADKTLFKIEDRVVVHPGDPQASTCSIRDTEYRVVSDLKYLVPCSSKIPMKLAALLGGRGLSIYSAALTILDHVRSILNNNKERSINDLLKILVICNDEFSMLAIQLLIYLIQLDNDNEPPKILFALAALKDDGLIWYKKNMPQVKLIQWNSDAYDQDLVERTRDACKGDVDIVLGCLGLGAPLQRSFKCLKKGGTAFVTEEINEKVLKSLQKMAEQQNKSIQIVQQGSIDDLKKLLALVADEVIQPAFLQEDNTQTMKNPVDMRRKARSLSSRKPPTLSIKE